MATIKSFTSIEQSRKLAKILPLESADMFWLVLANTPRVHVLTEPLSNYSQWESYPCWSLSALLGVIRETIGGYTLYGVNNVYICCNLGDRPWKLETEEYDNEVDACVDMIEKLHELKLL